MNASIEVSLSSPLDSSRNSNLNPKRSFAFDKDSGVILASLGSNHAYLEQWQNKRKSLISTHFSILETIYQRVCQESDVSVQKTEFLIEFLRCKSLQIHKFASLNQKNIAFRKQSLESSSETKNQLDPFADIWGNMDIVHANLQKKTQQFSSNIDQAILKSILLEEQRNFTSVISKYKTKVAAFKKRLEKLDQETEIRFVSYSRVYDEFVKEITSQKKITSRKSLYLYEHEFLSAAFDHEKLFREYSSNMIEFFKDFWQMEENKAEKIHLALTKYYEEFKSLFRSRRDLTILETLIAEIQPKNICAKTLQLRNLLTDDQISNILKKQEGGDLSDVTSFLRAFKFEEIVESELILGKFTCSRQMNKNKNKEQKAWVDGMAIITKDSWLLFINDVKDMYKEPEYLLDLCRCSFADLTEDMTVVITEKNKGWCKKDSVHWVKLDSNNDREDFLNLLKGGKL